MNHFTFVSITKKLISDWFWTRSLKKTQHQWTMENSNQANPKQKFLKLKSFVTVQKNFSKMGFTPELVQQPYPFNWKILMHLLLLTVCVNGIGIYVYNDANSFIEYTQSALAASGAFLVIFLMILLIFKVNKLFQFFSRSDFMLNSSK